MKKATFPSLPFCIGAYKLSKVKGVEYFVKEIETFHFGEKSFARNDSRGKVTKNCTIVKIHFEYADFFNKYEEVFIRENNMTELKKVFCSKKRCQW